jgi:hypothetical protein
LKGFIMAFELDKNVQDVLLTNNDRGKVGLSAGIDLGIGAEDVSIFSLGLTVESFKKCLDRGAIALISTNLISVKQIVAGDIVETPVDSAHNQEVKGLENNPMDDDVHVEPAKGVVNTINKTVVEQPKTNANTNNANKRR